MIGFLIEPLNSAIVDDFARCEKNELRNKNIYIINKHILRNDSIFYGLQKKKK